MIPSFLVSISWKPSTTLWRDFNLITLMFVSVIDQTLTPLLKKLVVQCMQSLSKASLSIGVPQNGQLIEYLRLLRFVRDSTFTNQLLNSLNTACLLEIDSNQNTDFSSKSISMEQLSGHHWLVVFLLENITMETFQLAADTTITNFLTLFGRSIWDQLLKKPLFRSLMPLLILPKRLDSHKHNCLLPGLSQIKMSVLVS